MGAQATVDGWEFRPAGMDAKAFHRKLQVEMSVQDHVIFKYRFSVVQKPNLPAVAVGPRSQMPLSGRQSNKPPSVIQLRAFQTALLKWLPQDPRNINQIPKTPTDGGVSPRGWSWAPAASHPFPGAARSSCRFTASGEFPSFPEALGSNAAS